MFGATFDAVHQMGGDGVDVGADAGQGLGGEGTGNQTAEAGVVGRIAENQPAAEVVDENFNLGLAIGGERFVERRDAVSGHVGGTHDVLDIGVAQRDPAAYGGRPMDGRSRDGGVRRSGMDWRGSRARRDRKRQH